MKKNSVLVIFSETLPDKSQKWWEKFDLVIAPQSVGEQLRSSGRVWKPLSDLVEPGSIYEASSLLEELSLLKLPDGQRLSKSFVYQGFELWWMYYDTLYLYYCLPYTQHRKLLEYANTFKNIYLFEPRYRWLYTDFFKAHGKKPEIISNTSTSFFPLGVLIQMILTLVSLPLLALRKSKMMIFTGDEFYKERDHHFRMRFVYDELRKREFRFVEFIRSLEPVQTVLLHAIRRKRPVIYTDAITYVGRVLSFLTGGRRKARDMYIHLISNSDVNVETHFKFLLATRYLLCAYDDIWSIRILRAILKIIGIRSAFILAGMSRNFQTVLACKLNGIPTVGILHGVQSRFYNVYDYMPTFDGRKPLSVDYYGLWSEWWKDHYTRYSNAYRKNQLFVSGPMLPLEHMHADQDLSHERPQVLFVSEESAVPAEVLPYLYKLMADTSIDITIKFRPGRDGFETWLQKNHPEMFEHPRLHFSKEVMHQAIQKSNVVVGSYSTGVLEALAQQKIPIFFHTEKWGDYFGMKESEKTKHFFAETPDELVQKIKATSDVPVETLKEINTQYFGDPFKNGSVWVVDQLESLTQRQ